MRKHKSNRIKNIEVGKLRHDKKTQRHPQKNKIVESSVSLRGYDAMADPLFVYQDPEHNGYFIVIDGNKRLSGAKRNKKIESLPCIIITAPTIGAARQQVEKNNAPVQEIRDKMTFAYHIIETLDISYRDRPRTKNLSISKEELFLLAATAGKGVTVCNRVLTVCRKIYKVYLNLDILNIQKSIKNLFLEAIESGKYPELTDFYKEDISVRSLENRYQERIETSSTQNKISLPKNPPDLPPEAIKGTQKKESVKDLNDNLSNAPILEATAPFNISRSEQTGLELIDNLRNAALYDAIGLTITFNSVKQYLTAAPSGTIWMDMIVKWVAANQPEFQALLQHELEVAKAANKSHNSSKSKRSNKSKAPKITMTDNNRV